MDISELKKAAQAAVDGEFPPLPAPMEIIWPELHRSALGCGVEDRGIRCRYEAAEYGWQDGADKAAGCVPDDIFDSATMREYTAAAVAKINPAAVLALIASHERLVAALEMAKLGIECAAEKAMQYEDETWIADVFALDAISAALALAGAA